MYDYVEEYFNIIKALHLYHECDKKCDSNWKKIIVDCNFDCDLAVAVVELKLEEIIRIKNIKNNKEDLEFYKGVLKKINKIYDFEKR